MVTSCGSDEIRLGVPQFKPSVTARRAKTCLRSASEGTTFRAAVEDYVAAMIAQDSLAGGDVKFASAFFEQRETSGSFE
jgi:hypothetical protein